MTNITNTHVSKLLQQRVSTGRYDPDFEIDNETITDMEISEFKFINNT